MNRVDAPIRNRVRVVLLNAALGPLDYRVPEDMDVFHGSIVMAPLGPRKMPGVVWDADSFPVDEIDAKKLRPLLELREVPPLSAPLRKLIEWVARYYFASPASVLRMVLSSGAAFADNRPITEYRLNGNIPKRMTPQREQALEKLAGVQGTISELAFKADVSIAVMRGLEKAGALDSSQASPFADITRPDPDFAKVDLSDDQKQVSEKLVHAVQDSVFQPYLLDGVTGSGKTEVYFEAVAEALRQDKQTLVLLPEIALTEPFLDRFKARFGTEPIAWHSGLKQSDRKRNWHALADGDARVIVGARSALFLPYKNLGLIIVDEAHEVSFKQEDGVRYHARDVAVMRGLHEKIPIVLASATPAIESRHQVEQGNYELLELPARFGAATLPEIEALDLTQDIPERGSWLAPTLINALEENLAKGEQSLLFLNRRGFAPLTLCRTCGHRINCPNCTAWMVEHRLTKRLACHHCGHVMPQPEKCPECGDEDSLVACGPGVERICDEVQMLFPQARTAIVTSDTIWSPAKAGEFVAQMEAGAIDIVVGTQLVTKGYHFPNLTLVGVVDADIGLEGGDLRAAERSFQQIAQVAGRAGRADKPGHVYVQTRMPSAPVIQALIKGDRDGFYNAETESRRAAAAPPFSRLAAIIISSEDNAEAIETARLIGQTAPKLDGFAVYGPAPAPLAMLRGRHRHRLLVHAHRSVELQAIMHQWLEKLEWPRAVRVGVDVDPYSFV
ncbi:primosomal protein N' [Parasphingorhabdus cellanae]|uniref:Replication restart protein PriA n=1 Tax=Parasphingorhabdus cellanae TaxID=2806553 RepID=A0ABX7TB81_9SPHN|nr:primosomal protein N' [Parasphingorhabdus cellanae]QTD57897.1 primosomal protein N' [Parasphingorhabdus cellanae]